MLLGRHHCIGNRRYYYAFGASARGFEGVHLL
jgi:hypothetical protein